MAEKQMPGGTAWGKGKEWLLRGYKKRKCCYNTGLCFNAATSNLTPASISSMSRTSTGEWIYREGILTVVLGIPPLVR